MCGFYINRVAANILLYFFSLDLDRRKIGEFHVSINIFVAPKSTYESKNVNSAEISTLEHFILSFDAKHYYCWTSKIMINSFK